jgi:hypothetical protein
MDLRSKDAIESSEQHDIEIGNILIAEFMGLPLVLCNIGTENGAVTEGYQHPKVDVPCTANGLQYKYSWDWLMPVIQKCRQENRLEYFDRVYYALEECDINVTYKAVVEFIKNQNN